MNTKRVKYLQINYNDAIHELYGVSLNARHIIVLIADINTKSSPCLKGKHPTEVNMPKLENDAEIIFKTCMQPCQAQCLPVNNFLSLAVGTNDPDDTPESHVQLYSRIVRATRSALDSISNILGLKLHVAVSAVHRNIGNVYDAYLEAHAIVENYTLLEGESDIITVEDVMADDDPGDTVRMPLEKQWFSFSTAYQFPQARDVLKQIVSVKMSSMRTAVTIKTELFHRMNYVTYFICDCKGINHSVRTAMQSRLQTIWAAHEKDQIFEWIDQIYASMEHLLSMDQSDIAWSERMISFIRSNYMNPQLDVNLISRRFGLNAAYASHIFRQSTGIRLLDYIHNVRIEHITRLLAFTEKSLSEIALETGFSDQQGMSRVFRRYVKMSPTQYRKSHRTERPVMPGKP